MCGISILWGASEEDSQKSVDALKARGPDATSTEVLTSANGTLVSVGFTRLHIQGDGALGEPEQPFRRADKSLVLCNGEIFNAFILARYLSLSIKQGSSDCAVIPALLDRGDSLANVCRLLDGDFAIALVDLSADTVTVARDPYGVRPLFYATNGVWSGVASEIKAFPADATRVEAIEPGTIRSFSFSSSTGSTEVWHQPPWLKNPIWRIGIQNIMQGGLALRTSLIEAVVKRLPTTRGIGACLSGGLDSSIVAAIAAMKLRESNVKLHTYSIGMEGSPDLEFARQVAAHIQSEHHEKIVTSEECLAVIPEVVKAIESFDITTVRASVGNYLLGRLVKEVTPDVKVVLNGDGADEVLGGYLYMKAAPNDLAFEQEISRLLSEIHRYDVLRSERCMAAHGLESRSPFLDRQFVSVARALPTPNLRTTDKVMEKSMLRAAFKGEGFLPENVLFRRKEAFSDGISRAENSWFEMAKAEGVARSGADWAEKAAAYVVNPPPTAEALWYRELFHDSYPVAASAAAAPEMWMPRFVKASDPSARTLEIYQA